jgi:hypothetical protein
MCVQICSENILPQLNPKLVAPASCGSRSTGRGVHAVDDASGIGGSTVDCRPATPLATLDSCFEVLARCMHVSGALEQDAQIPTNVFVRLLLDTVGEVLMT